MALAAATATLLGVLIAGPARADDIPGPPAAVTSTDGTAQDSTTPPTDASTTSSTTTTPTPTPTATATATATTAPPHLTPSPGRSHPAVSPSHSPSQGPPAPNKDDDGALTPAQLAAQLAQAQLLQRQQEAANAALAAIQAKMARLSTQAATALQALQTAKRTEQQALANQALQQQRLTELQAQAAALHDQLTRWARQAYVTGGALAHYEAYLAALGAGNTDEVGNSLYLIDYVGRGEDQAVTDARTLAQVQVIVTQQAADSAEAATTARVQAQTASTQVQALLAQQRKQLAAEQAAQPLTARATLTTGVGAVGTSTASCGRGVTRASVKGYGNGQIPATALCPLWGASGQLLRADAAAAFAKMSRSYAAQFGQPICVTDSYRSYSQQVALYAAKPNLAARPGTSNHGWGVAVDLCGGVQSFGTAQHTWLFEHAPLFGWFHPAWAEPTGSRPEPWHWEFGG